MDYMADNDESLGLENSPNVVPDPTENQQFLRNQQVLGNHENFGNRQNPGYQTITRNQQSRSNRTGFLNKRNALKPENSFEASSREDKLYREMLCRELKFHFMGPHDKIKARRKPPWKLFIQVVKVIMLTIQLILFGFSRSSFVDFREKTTLAMKHLYLLNWTNAYETMPYPAAIGEYALYEKSELMDHINFAMKQYDLTEKVALASLKLFRKNGTCNQHQPMKMCLEHYKSGEITADNTYDIDSTVLSSCYPVGRLCNGSYDIATFMNETYNATFNFDRLLQVTLKFQLQSFRLDNVHKVPPQLYHANVQIAFDNHNKDGQMLVELTADLCEVDMIGHSSDDDADDHRRAGFMVFDGFVLLVTVLSILLCSRAVLRAQALRRKTMKFFKRRFNKDLSWADRFEFLNLWYVTIIINDVLTIVGTGYKIELESKELKSSCDTYDICTVMLGTGSLLAWLGVLRYIGFFQQFNILIVTLKKAFPNMLRFLVCCILLYIGFVICGWVVLGPYHIKFRYIGTTSECLFSLLNGDDMFVTFSATVTDSGLIWYYSRIYLYVFISLFIYAVLNLFIAVIMDTYETIKEYYEKGFPKSELFEFIDQCQDPAHSSIYRQEDNSYSLVSAFCCCKPNPDNLNEYTSLIR